MTQGTAIFISHWSDVTATAALWPLQGKQGQFLILTAQR